MYRIKNIDFDISETVTKNTIIYGTFNQRNWDHKAKKYGYWYTN